MSAAGSDLDRADVVIELDRARIAVVAHQLDPRNGASAQERDHLVPVVGRPVPQAQGYGRECGSTVPARPQAAGRPPVEPAKRVVEAAHAAEAGGGGYLRHGELRLLDELLGEQDAPRLGHCDGRRTQVTLEQAAQMPFAYPEPRGQLRDAMLVVHEPFADQ